MYRNVLNYLRGSVLVSVEAPYPERVLNLCAAHDIPFWALQWRSPERLSLRTTRLGLRRLRRVAPGADAAVTAQREQGVPELWRRVKGRYVLLAGAAVFVLGLLLGSVFIWDFEVSGNETVPTETILRALEDYGVRIGTPGLSIDQEDLRNHVLLQLPDVSWLAVNVRGCTAHIQVVERLRPPEIVQEGERTNVVARRDALVTKVQALDGQAQVLPGTTVTEGQLLISGVADGGAGGVRLLHGMGEVWGRTWYDLSVRMPLTTRPHAGEGRRSTRVALDFGKRRVKLYGKGSITGGDCDKMIAYRPCRLPLGLRLPVTLVVERTTRYDAPPAQRSAEEARREGEALLMEQLRAMLGEDGSVTDTRLAAAADGDDLVVTLQAECLEQIGRSVPLAE
jgi:similar to stage IV sporulation protein